MISIFAGIQGSHGLSGDGGMATSAVFWNPRGLVVDKTGNRLFVCTYHSLSRCLAYYSLARLTFILGQLQAIY